MKPINPKGAGIGIDASGGPVVDPTANVIALNEAATKRQDDLRQASEKFLLAQLADLKDTLGSMEKHQRELDAAESGRLNSIRQVDRDDVAKTAAAAQTGIQTLAATTTTMAETLRTQVATVAGAAENRQSAFAMDVNKRLSALELSSSEGKGKQSFADPQMEKLTQVVEKLAASQNVGSGKHQGMSAAWAILIGAAGLFLTLLSIAAILFAVLQK